ncbi:MAG: holo-[acyl-carrier-protein] synthase [Clostridiales bacterium 38-18]|nr:MAG: holo-[acyl-carrier-protein] synthase [Clostridiales bacterium 38-18]
MIGVDMVEIERIKKLIEKNERFIERNFSEKERILFREKANPLQSISANFAGKEAVSKVFGTGIRGFNLNDISIERDDLGKPIVVLYNGALEQARRQRIQRVELSLSHTSEHAIAFAIAIFETT